MRLVLGYLGTLKDGLVRPSQICKPFRNYSPYAQFPLRKRVLSSFGNP